MFLTQFNQFDLFRARLAPRTHAYPCLSAFQLLIGILRIAACAKPSGHRISAGVVGKQ